ncbi:hypothetical protein [Streptomyces xanthophaeus]
MTAVPSWDRQPLRSEDVTASTQAVWAGKAVFGTASGMLAASADLTPTEGAARLHPYADHHRQRPPT